MAKSTLLRESIANKKLEQQRQADLAQQYVVALKGIQSNEEEADPIACLLVAEGCTADVLREATPADVREILAHRNHKTTMGDAIRILSALRKSFD